MPTQPAYLTLNRHNTYYFRVVIPLPLRVAFGLQREIRRSLKTDSLRLALRRARQYAARFEAVFDKALHVINDDFIPTEEDLRLFNEELERAGKPEQWGQWTSDPAEKEEASAPALSDEDRKEIFDQQRRQLIVMEMTGSLKGNIPASQQELAKRLFDDYYDLPLSRFRKLLPQILDQLALAKLGAQPTPPSMTQVAPEPDGLTLFEIWQQQWDAEYKLALASNRKPKSERTKAAERGYVHRLNILSGNKPINRLSLDDFNRIYLQTFEIKVSRGTKLPAPDSPLESILAEPGMERIDSTTADKLIIRLGVLHKYAFKKGMTSVSPDQTDKPSVSKPSKDALEPEKSFETEDLEKIFNGWLFTGTERNHRHKVFPYQFWLPVLAYFTGGRLNELSQLDTEDVKQIKGIWTITIVDDPEDRPCPKSVKNNSSRRVVPLHSELLRMGFLEFWKQAAQEGREKLFSDGLVYNINKGWGGIATQFFCRMPSDSTPVGGYFYNVGIRTRDEQGRTDSKNFHSFRHTFTDLAREAGAEAYLVLPDLTGHSRTHEGQHASYGNGFSLAKKLEILEALPMPVSLRHVTYQDFERRLGKYLNTWTQRHRDEHGLNQSEPPV
ncbi:integrase [Metapseudomonas resinovorans]|uniref:site-specific integrase n=1 Tax=Metapseudomonas resinovorans TaxID=53412 RepID=UPI000986F999|nr:site-specific integrase [Pseudomonas resinovorans]GLZ88703.1 integrase [Pseudomonas resinovorans]